MGTRVNTFFNRAAIEKADCGSVRRFTDGCADVSQGGWFRHGSQEIGTEERPGGRRETPVEYPVPACPRLPPSRYANTGEFRVF